jgi:hypothetical protein
VHLTHPVQAARVKQDALGRGGLAGVDVGRDTDVARALQRILAVLLFVRHGVVG